MNHKISMRDSLYLTDDPKETTFKYDNQLPSLPVPEVEASTMKLLDTIKPIALDQALYRETEAKARRFIQDPQVKELQELLKGRARESKNWLESWWLEFAYLRSRKPLIPYSNMSAPLPIMPYWPVLNRSDGRAFEEVRAKRAALSTFFQLSFWRMLRDEQMRPMIHKGVPWSMAQFRYLFNTVRLPGEPKDELRSWFRTSNEGEPESTEIIVLHRGHIFAIKPVIMAKDGRALILSAPQIESQLRQIEDWCRQRPYGPGVGSLTTRERSEWAEAREKLQKVAAKNVEHLQRIERALSVLVLEEEEPGNEEEIMAISMCGEPRNRWADKSITSIAFKNGTFGANADHTPYDGFCTAIMTHYLMTSVEECDGQWRDELATANVVSKLQHPEVSPPPPELLDFKLDIEMGQLIEEARQQFATISTTIDTLHRTFNHFGKGILKEHRFHPEAFVQCAIHAAYFRQHGKMAPAYVTASTRRFHNGRTETCRSCYPEMLDFAQFLRDNNKNPTSHKQAYQLLKVSVEKFQRLMEEASQARGCDRHLMGLYLTAILEGRPIPELFEDELVQRTNNYVLSTSCGGYWNVCGGVPPLVEEGYGCFYGIEDHAITFCCTAYKPSPVTDLRRFYENLEQCLLEMLAVLKQQQPSRL